MIYAASHYYHIMTRQDPATRKRKRLQGGTFSKPLALLNANSLDPNPINIVFNHFSAFSFKRHMNVIFCINNHVSSCCILG